jgi:hypothetical protein
MFSVAIFCFVLFSFASFALLPVAPLQGSPVALVPVAPKQGSPFAFALQTPTAGKGTLLAVAHRA